MKKSVIYFGILLFARCSKVDQDKHYDFNYERSAHKCPEKEDETSFYLNSPHFPDLKSINAKLENIPNLDSHADLRKENEGSEFKIFFELAKKFDAKKPTIIMIPGGPGMDHTFFHAYAERFPKLYDTHNVVAMDHRGVGCSKSLAPGDPEAQAHLMRYAAYDIEMIRKRLLGENTKINVWGGSYGTMLAQTYTMLFPNSVDKVILAGAFSASADFSEAQQKFESLVTSASPETNLNFRELKSLSPSIAEKFLLWSVQPMYSYKGRLLDVPLKLKEVLAKLKSEKPLESEALIPPARWVMNWMTRSIVCIEIFRPGKLSANETPMFPFNFETCREFEGKFEYFDYTESLKLLKHRVLLISGFFDHVTPFDAMNKMSKKLSNSFFHVDAHLGHDVISGKPECLDSLFREFLNNGSDQKLRNIELENSCQSPPSLM